MDGIQTQAFRGIDYQSHIQAREARRASRVAALQEVVPASQIQQLSEAEKAIAAEYLNSSLEAVSALSEQKYGSDLSSVFSLSPSDQKMESASAPRQFDNEDARGIKGEMKALYTEMKMEASIYRDAEKQGPSDLEKKLRDGLKVSLEKDERGNVTMSITKPGGMSERVVFNESSPGDCTIERSHRDGTKEKIERKGDAITRTRNAVTLRYIVDQSGTLSKEVSGPSPDDLQKTVIHADGSTDGHMLLYFDDENKPVFEQTAKAASGLASSPMQLSASAGGALSSSAVSATKPGASSGPAQPTEFSKLVRENFSKWDKDGDGFISKAEIDKLLQDPSIKGDAAAALATLKAMIDTLQGFSDDEWGPENDGVTLKDIEEYERRRASGKDKDARAVDNVYYYSKQRINGASRQLFAHGVPDPKAAQQGNVGDCYFIAAVVSKAASDPQAIKNMIKDNNDGTYTVTFPGQKPVKVTAPTDAEIANYSGAGADGIWLSVLEKAYGQLLNENAWIFTTGSPQDAADGGASLSTGISAITGNSVDTDILSFTSLDTTRNKLEKALKAGKVVTAGIRGNLPLIESDSRDNGLPMGHAYSIIAYDRKSDMVTVRNPWGRGEPVDAQGRPKDGVDDGIFTIKLTEFDQYFSMIAYEE
jgi:hypothetical protein